jgi:nitroimidazol reductase NimA-like FMN-containing flavoprotein (pyridoxamine 5'-phosphate oxidase superfamily)
MQLQEMTKEECLNAIRSARLGRLACARENQPYVVPVYLVYHDPYLYGFATLGQKIEWMRANPRVCVELDEIVNGTEWISIVIFGTYEELPSTPENHDRWNHHRRLPLQGKSPDKVSEPTDERRQAHKLLQEHTHWWEPGCVVSKLRRQDQALSPIFYRIRVGEVTGRRVMPGAAEPSGRSVPSSTVRTRGRLRKALRRIFLRRDPG